MKTKPSTDSALSSAVAQASKPAASPTPKSARRGKSGGQRVRKPAINQIWQSALRFACAAALFAVIATGAQNISLESAPPVVVKTVPVAGAMDVDPALSELRVTFSKAMQDGSWSWSTWGAENFPEIVGEPKYLADGRTCVIKVKLRPGKFYATWLNSDKFHNFQDASGRPAVPYLLTFTTSPAARYGTGPAGFGPVAETVLKSPEGRVAELLDLDTGGRATSDNFGENDRETHIWIRDSKLDVLGVVEKGQIALLCMDMVVPPAPDHSFDRITPDEVRTNWHLAQGEPNKITGLSPSSDKTDTFFFRTREGGQGILQIVGESTEPRGVKIRYKMLPQSGGTAGRRGSNSGGGGDGELIERDVNRLVSEFPETTDLSTPETACAAWQRAYARKDAAAISKLSLAPLTAKEQEDWFAKLQQTDPTGLTLYLKALTESKIVAVQIWRDELANVITFLSFPEGQGRYPYSSRSFGRVKGEWKNLGEDRLPDLETVKANFASKKERLWQHFQELKSAPTGAGAVAPSPPSAMPHPNDAKLNEDQRAVLAWTDRQFKSFFDRRTFDGWSPEERVALERKLIDALSGPRSTEYYQAINSLAALRSTNALPRLREIAFERVDRNNRDRWMSVRALGLIGDKESVPELIHLVYHGNQNTHWWAQISLVRLTGQNFGGDWNAWGKWWNDQQGQPPYKPEIIRWWNGQPEPDKLAQALEAGDQKFLESVKPK